MLQIIYVPESTYNLIAGPFIDRIFFIIRIFFSIYSVVLLLAIILIIYRMRLVSQIRTQIKEIEASGQAPSNRIFERWQKIKERLETNDENNYKLAILEADAMFDSIIDNAGYKGKDLEDRLKQIPPSDISNLNEVMDVHKTRDSIVYNANISITRDQAKSAIEIFEKALKELEVF